MDKTISLYVHEEAMSRMERSNVRTNILCVILLITLLLTNGGWLYYESLFNDKVTTVTQELSSEGNATINDGVHINGENKTDGNN